jgi:hypothetical protein
MSDHRVESPPPRNPKDVVRLQRLREHLRARPAKLLSLEVIGSVHRADDEHVPQAIASREFGREFHVDLRRRSDLDPDDPIPTGVVEQAGNLEAGDAQLLGDLALARAVQEVPSCDEHGGDQVEARGLSIGLDQGVHLLLRLRPDDGPERSEGPPRQAGQRDGNILSSERQALKRAVEANTIRAGTDDDARRPSQFDESFEPGLRARGSAIKPVIETSQFRYVLVVSLPGSS